MRTVIVAPISGSDHTRPRMCTHPFPLRMFFLSLFFRLVFVISRPVWSSCSLCSSWSFSSRSSFSVIGQIALSAPPSGASGVCFCPVFIIADQVNLTIPRWWKDGPADEENVHEQTDVLLYCVIIGAGSLPPGIWCDCSVVDRFSRKVPGHFSTFALFIKSAVSDPSLCCRISGRTGRPSWFLSSLVPLLQFRAWCMLVCCWLAVLRNK
jgi:hypothetical protein